jgi:DNA-3-methyladenine glycosylase II
MTPFAALMRSIVYQQLSGRAAGTIWGRVLDVCPCKRFPKPDDVLAVDYETLRAAGLSNNKALAVHDLADKANEGIVPGRRMLNRMDDESIIERLTQVRGIGRWTVEMLLMFHLGRPDVFPVGDLGVRKGIAATYGLDNVPDADEIEAYGGQMATVS